MKKIKNFSIIAHINHGKSTLADRFIQICNNLKEEEMKEQMLDSMELEREKGITIKSQCVTLKYKSYIFNLIDTPGHADFSYEVSRALSACEGAILLIDATQGIEAQTIANYNKAMEHNLYIIIVLNKIDSINANIEKTKNEIKEILKIESNKILNISAKKGIGIIDLIEEIIKKIPSPSEDVNKPLKAFIIDSWFNNYLGVISLIKVKEGVLNKKDKIIIFSTKKIYKIIDIGIFTPKKENKEQLKTGEIGFIVTGNKDINSMPVGDTISLSSNPLSQPLPGFEKIKPKIYAGMFPEKQEEFNSLKDSLAKLKLNDSSLIYETQSSNIFGSGFRCGFLGLLHMEIIKERLIREYNQKLIITPPNVVYKINLKNKKNIYIDNPSKIENMNEIQSIEEPIATANIITTSKYINNVIELCSKYRGKKIKIEHFNNQISIIYNIPLNEIIFNFIGELKTITRGYSSLEYSFSGFKESNLTKLSILINNKNIDFLEFIVHKDEVYRKGKKIIEIMKDIIPKHMFDIVIQASINKKIIAKTVIKALKKNVIAKCYGGDITRKKKLIKKQVLGKKKMKSIGKVDIPQKVFTEIFEKSRS